MCNNSILSLPTIIVSIVTSAFVQRTHSAWRQTFILNRSISLKLTGMLSETFEHFPFEVYACALVIVCLHFTVVSSLENPNECSRLRNLKGVSTHFCCRKDRPLNWNGATFVFRFFYFFFFSSKFPGEWNTHFPGKMWWNIYKFASTKHFVHSVHCCVSTCNDVRLAAQHNSKNLLLKTRIARNNKTPTFLAIPSSLMCVASTVIVFSVAIVLHWVFGYLFWLCVWTPRVKINNNKQI